MSAADSEAGMFAAAFDELAVGDAFSSPARAITRRDVDVFAGLTGDHHPLHTDHEWAEAGPFGKLIVHGLLIVSCAVGSLPLDPERVIAMRRIRDVVFKRPLPVEGAVAVECKVVELTAVDAATGLVGCTCRIVDAEDRLIARAILEILWRRGGEGDELACVEAGEDGIKVLL